MDEDTKKWVETNKKEGPGALSECLILAKLTKTDPDTVLRVYKETDEQVRKVYYGL